MKKGTKIALLVSAVLLVVGATLCAVTLARVGFRPEKLSPASSSPLTYQWVDYEKSDISRITLSIQASAVVILPSSDDQVHLQYPQRQDQHFDVTLQGGLLEIRQIHDVHSLRFGIWDDGKLTLQLPDAMACDLEIQGDLGDVDLPKPLQLNGTLDCQISAGSFSAEGLHARSVTVEADLGNVEGEDWSIREEVHLSADTGSVELQSSTVGGSLFCESDLGDIDLERVSAADVRLTASTGSIDLERLAADTIDLSADLGSVEGTIEGSEAEYTVRTEVDLGDCSLRDRDGTTEKTLTVCVDTGDIDLRFTRP